MVGTPKLELTWAGKQQQLHLEPRLLREEKALAYRATSALEFRNEDNILIHGDNRSALEALRCSFTGQVKCVFIDPPYNTGGKFSHFSDDVAHSTWLASMKQQLERIHALLRDDGSLWISIDDNEVHYLKVLCDEVFGRANYITSVIWQKALSVKNSTKHFSSDHDYILVYAKNASIWRPNPVPAGARQHASYKNLDGDPRGAWQSISLSARNYYSKGSYQIICPGGRVIEGPPPGSYWRISSDKLADLNERGEIWWGKSGNGIPRRKMYLKDQGELTKAPQTIWFHEDVGHTQDAKKEALALNRDDVFGAAKPERLMKRILDIATNAGDIVLDSFAGSGTTGAVAHKLGRRWIMVELGDHCLTHIAPRLRRVIDGTDAGGVSEEVNWRGGGSYRHFNI